MCVTFGDSHNKMANLFVTEFCFNGPLVPLCKHGTSLALIFRKFVFSESFSLKGIFASLFRKVTGYLVSLLPISFINFLPLQPKPRVHTVATHPHPDCRRMVDVAKLCCCVISPFTFFRNRHCANNPYHFVFKYGRFCLTCQLAAVRLSNRWTLLVQKEVTRARIGCHSISTTCVKIQI